MAVREAALTGSRKIVQVLTELRPAGAERIVSNLSRELVRRGYTEADIQKIWSGNLLRVWRAVEAVSADW